MGDGLQRATLAALCSRGPWVSGGVTVTEADVRGLLRRILDGGQPDSASIPDHVAKGHLRKAGLIEYTGTPKRWRVVGGGAE